MRASPFACGPTRMISGGSVAPAVPWHPPDINSLVAWWNFRDISTLFINTAGTTPLTTSGQTIACATDTISGINATRSVSDERPIYDGSGASFDGSNDRLVFPAPITTNQPHTAVTMFRRTAGGSESPPFSIAQHVNGKTIAGMYLNSLGVPNYRWGTDAASGLPIINGSPTTVALDELCVMAATFDGSTVRGYVNGVEVASQETTLGIVSGLVSGWIGSMAWGNFFTGMVCDAMICDAALSGEDLLKLSDWLLNEMIEPVEPSANRLLWGGDEFQWDSLTFTWG